MTETQLVAWTGANATNTITSGSFTPAANSLVVLVTGCGNSGGVTVTGISVTDSVGGTWKKLVQLTGGGQFADASVWVKDAGSSPSAQTVTVTMFPSSVNDLGLSVRQFTGAASAANQNGATNTASGTIATIGITPNVTGSQVVGAAGWAGSTAGTANASTTLYGQTNDATGGASDGGFKATSLSTGGTPLTLGFTATASGRGMAVAEILPVPLIPGNELNLNTQSIETDASGWLLLTNSTVAQSAAQAYDGTNSLSITATASGVTEVITATPYPAVTPGTVYQFFFAAYTTSSGIVAQADGDFYNVSTFVSSFAPPNVALTPNQWTWVSVTQVAPATATLLRPIPHFVATAPGQVVFIDSVYFGLPTLFPGTSTLFPMQPQRGGPTWRRRYRRRQTPVQAVTPSGPYIFGSSSNTAASTTRTVPVSAQTLNGDTLLLTISTNGVTVSAVTDSQGNVYTLDTSSASSPQTYFYRSPGATGGPTGGLTAALSNTDTISITVSAGSTQVDTVMLDVPQCGPLDAQSATTNGSAASTIGVSATPTQDGDIAVCSAGISGAETISSPFITLGSPVGSGPFVLDGWRQLPPGSGGVSQTATFNWSGTLSYRTKLWLFKAGPPPVSSGVNAPAGVATVSAVAPDAVNPQVTVNAAPAGVTATAPSPVASVAPPAGVAAVSTISNPPALSLTANPPAAAVSAVSVQPSVGVSFSAAAATVTVTANTAVAAAGVNTTAALVNAVAVQPSVSTTGSVNAPAGVATVSVVAVQPVTAVTVPAGAATVNASAPVPVPLVQPAAAPAVVSATSNPPGKAVSLNAGVSVVSASVPPGKASVAPNALVASVNAVSVQTVTAVTVPAGVSIVNAVSVQPTVSTVPTVNAPAGVATVAVTAMTASTSVTANAAPAVISVTANQTSTAHTANPGVAVIAVADPGSVASTGTTAPAGVATVAVTANPARGGVGPVAGAASVTTTATTAHTGITFGAAVGVVSAVANAASGPPKFIIIGLGIGAPYGKWGAGAPHTSGYSTGETHGGWSAGTAVDNGITAGEPHTRWSTGDPHD